MTNSTHPYTKLISGKEYLTSGGSLSMFCGVSLKEEKSGGEYILCWRDEKGNRYSTTRNGHEYDICELTLEYNPKDIVQLLEETGYVSQ